MNGLEYKQLYTVAQEGRDAALQCLRVLTEHERRLGVVEKKVDKNAAAVAVGRFGIRACAWVGSILIGLGGLLFGLWENIGGGGGDGPG